MMNMKYYHWLFKWINLFLFTEWLEIKKITLYSAIVAIIPSLMTFTDYFPIDTWVISNKTYLTIISGLIVMDHIAGTIAHIWWHKDHSLKANLLGLWIKVFVVVIVGLTFEGLAELTAKEDMVYTYLQMTLRILVAIYPARSILRNIDTISGGRFKTNILIAKTDKFQESLDIKDLTNNKE